MDNGEKKVSDLFDGKNIFNIPEYQRAYAWGTQQLSEFLDDINNQKLDRNYFLGTVLFEEQKKENSYNLIDIVDGQQRLTTIIIFMATLINRLTELSETEEEQEELELLHETYVKHKRQYKLRALEEDNDFFHSYILGSQNGKDFIRTPAQRRLHHAKDYFTNRLAKLDKATLLEIKTKIDDNSRILVYAVQDTAEATLIFETTNDRGKGLTNLEKIKSFTMYKSYVASEETPDELLGKIRSRFSEIYKEHEKFSGKLDEDSILQYHFTSHEPWTGKEYQQHVKAVKENINQLIATDNNFKAIGYIERYTRELKETFFVVHEILNSKLPALRDLLYLKRLGNFWPLLIKTWKLDDSPEKQQFHRVVQLMEKFTFRVYAINQNRSNTGQSTLFDLACRFTGDFETLILALSNLTKKYSKKKQFKEYLEHENLYNWMSNQDLNYFFWKYENHLRDTIQPKVSPMSEQELTTNSSKFKMTIEHIASQTPRKSVIVDTSILPIVDEDFAENHLHSIGNLTIDPLSANASKGNKEFAEKNGKYFLKAPFKTQNELENYLHDNQWTADSIEERTQRLVNFALEQWTTN